MLTVNFISHRRSQARFWDTLGSRECSSGIVNQALRSKSWHFPYEDPQTRIFTKQPCNSIQSGRKTMNYEDKCIKGAWNWSVFPQITAWLSNPAPTPFQEQTYTQTPQKARVAEGLSGTDQQGKWRMSVSCILIWHMWILFVLVFWWPGLLDSWVCIWSRIKEIIWSLQWEKSCKATFFHLQSLELSSLTTLEVGQVGFK